MLVLETSPPEEGGGEEESSKNRDALSEEAEPLMLESPTKEDETRVGDYPEENASPLILGPQEFA